MTVAWAAALPFANRRLAASLREIAGIEALAAADEGLFWLRGPRFDEAMERALRQLPGARRYTVAPTGELHPVGSRLPDGTLPAGEWRPLRAAFTLELPDAAYRRSQRGDHRDMLFPLRLERAATASSKGSTQATLLTTSFARFCAYGVTAPQLRLQSWSFACSETGECIVRGNPLPPLPGVQWCEREGVAVPAGYCWSPAIDAGAIRSLLGLQTGDLALLAPSGSWQLISAAAWVQASRSALRLSQREGAL